MELLFIGPADVRDELLAKCHEFFIKEVAAYRNAGANVLIYSNPFGSLDLVPLNYFKRHSLPWIEKDIAAVGIEGMVYYCGMARLNKIIETVIDRTHLGVFYISPLDDLAESKRIVAGKSLVCGVINDIKLVDWSVDEVPMK